MENQSTITVARKAASALLLVAVVAASWWPELDRFASNTVDAALTRALSAFAVARGINGLISVAQSAEVSVEPVGVGVSLSPGEILDPVNDLVEQFSTLMLAASASLGLQKLLIVASAWLPLKVSLSIAALAWLLLSWRGTNGIALTIARNAAIVLLALRFAVPLSALASEAAYHALLEDEYTTSSAALENARDTLGAQSRTIAPELPADAGVLDRARAWLNDTRAAVDLPERLQQLEATATDVTRHIINLIAVFIVQTMLLPLGFLWLAWSAVRRLADQGE